MWHFEDGKFEYEAKIGIRNKLLFSAILRRKKQCLSLCYV